MTDADIDFSDIPEWTSEDFKRAELQMPEPKQAVSIRLDRDLLDWLKRQGRGYQTRINAILRVYAEEHGLKRGR
jgi:uncharacterized protein (DUF4415 family)